MRLTPNQPAVIKLGPFRAEADATKQESLTILTTDIRLSRQTGNTESAFAAKTEATAPTHDEAAWYDVTLNSADVGVGGFLTVSCQPAGSLGAWRIFEIGVDPTSVEVHRTSAQLDIGTETGTSANTLAQDGVYWQWTSTAAGLDGFLVMNIASAGGNPSVLRIWGRFQSGKNRVIQPQAYNFTTAAYENLGAVITDDDADGEIVRGLGRSFVRRGQGGTPGADGDVRIRFLYDATVSGQVSPNDDLYLDEVSVFYDETAITSGELIQGLLDATPQRNYPFGAIHIDLTNGQPGQKYGTNGTPGNHVKTIADAIVLAEKAGFSTFYLKGGGTATIPQALPNWFWKIDTGTTIDMNGQDVDGSVFLGGRMMGTAVAASAGISCIASFLDALTAWGLFEQCKIEKLGALTASGPELHLHDCESSLPGAGNPSLSGGSVASLKLSILKYGGGIDIGGLANDANVTVSGTGSFTLTDAATSATIIRSGMMRQIGSDPTGATIVDEARVTQTTGMSIGDLAGSEPAAAQLRDNVLASTLR